jgi:hypothetical protein
VGGTPGQKRKCRRLHGVWPPQTSLLFHFMDAVAWLKGGQIAPCLITASARNVHLLRGGVVVGCKKLLHGAVLCCKLEVIRSKPFAWQCAD